MNRTINYCMIWTLTSFTSTVCHLTLDNHRFSCPSQNYVSLMMSATSTEESPYHPKCNVNDQTSRADSETVPVSNSNALAIVLYQEYKLLPHEKKHRTFQVAGYEFHIGQDWHAGGVAAVVWDAAVVLGHFLASNVDLVRNKAVLELGAGTGLAGMVASTLGADVTVTEREEAMSYLESAISKNQEGKNNWKIKAEVLDWTHDVDSTKWDNLDLVIGADIVYIEDTFPDLLKTLKAVAANMKTKVLLSCRIRYDRDLKFFHMLKKSFTVEEIFYNSELDIKIFSAISQS